MREQPHVIIYTDGGCDPNPGPGGWAVLLQFGDHERTLSGAEAQSTNNRMELTAAIQALQALKRSCQVDIYTDSQYLRKGITEWLPGWRRRGWRRKGGALANLDLWQTLDKLAQGHEIAWHWVRGHTGSPGNERVDALVRQARRQLDQG
jgi:ribonuclease HI